MTRKAMAEGLLQQALSSLESARKASRDSHWAFAVRSSQDASELSIKALLLTAGDDPPKIHDLGHVLRQEKDDLAELGLSESEVHRLADSARDLAQDRSKSLYGDEENDIPATDLFDKNDAARAVQTAELIHRRCRQVIEHEGAES